MFADSHVKIEEEAKVDLCKRESHLEGSGEWNGE